MGGNARPDAATGKEMGGGFGDLGGWGEVVEGAGKEEGFGGFGGIGGLGFEGVGGGRGGDGSADEEEEEPIAMAGSNGREGAFFTFLRLPLI